MGKKKYYLPSEVALHNTVEDCWVVVHYKIYDLTKWLKSYLRPWKYFGKPPCTHKECACANLCYCKLEREVHPIVALAGKDISMYFEADKTEYKTRIHPVFCTRVLLEPHGTWPEFSSVLPTPRWKKVNHPCWYEDDSLVVGYMTKNPRPISIVNTLTYDPVTIEVCEEETILEIMEFRYLPYNRHYPSYTWTYKGKKLCLSKTLTANGVLDERKLFQELDLPDDFYIPAVLIFFNDDFTIDIPTIEGFCRKYNDDI